MMKDQKRLKHVRNLDIGSLTPYRVNVKRARYYSFLLNVKHDLKLYIRLKTKLLFQSFNGILKHCLLLGSERDVILQIERHL